METNVHNKEIDNKENYQAILAVKKVAKSLSNQPPHRYRNITHLWEFLLELLEDETFSSIIAWTHKEEGEFKLRNANEVAKRWGEFKNKSDMTYDKLSRAIRCYYRQRIIQKVPGQRLVYKFDKLPYEYKPRLQKFRMRLEKAANPLRDETKNVPVEKILIQPLPTMKSVYPTSPHFSKDTPHYFSHYQQPMLWFNSWFEVSQGPAMNNDSGLSPLLSLPYCSEMGLSRLSTFLSCSTALKPSVVCRKSIPVSVIKSSNV